jgi:hypothetical protein
VHATLDYLVFEPVEDIVPDDLAAIKNTGVPGGQERVGFVAGI